MDNKTARKVLYCVIVLVSCMTYQSCKNESPNLYVGMYLIPDGVTDITMTSNGYETEESSKYSKLAGFTADNQMWLGVYCIESREKRIEYIGPITNGRNQTFIGPFGDIQNIYLNTISLVDFSQRDNGNIFLVNLNGPTELIVRLNNIERRYYNNKTGEAIYYILDWHDGDFFALGEQSYLFDKNGNIIERNERYPGLSNNLIPIERFLALESNYPGYISLKDIKTNNTKWMYRYLTIDEESRIDDKEIIVIGDTIDCRFIITSYSGIKKEISFKVNKKDGVIIK